MALKTLIEAVNEALHEEMERDPNVIVLGEDVGVHGGVFRATDGLQKRFGADRVIDTPLAELGIVGVAIGAAMQGLHPVAEIQFADYIHPAYDQTVDIFAPPELRGNPAARRAWAESQVRKAVLASRKLGLSRLVGFPGSLLWPFLYLYPPRPFGLVEEGFAELARRWRPILDLCEDNGVDLCFEVHPGEDLHDGGGDEPGERLRGQLVGLVRERPRQQLAERLGEDPGERDRGDARGEDRRRVRPCRRAAGPRQLRHGGQTQRLRGERDRDVDAVRREQPVRLRVAPEPLREEPPVRRKMKKAVPLLRERPSWLVGAS